MSREVDVRAFTVNRVEPARANDLRGLANTVSAGLPGSHRVSIRKFDATTGNPALVSSSGAAAVSGDFVMRALQHVLAISPALGLTAQAPEFVACLLYTSDAADE